MKKKIFTLASFRFIGMLPNIYLQLGMDQDSRRSLKFGSESTGQVWVGFRSGLSLLKK